MGHATGRDRHRDGFPVTMRCVDVDDFLLTCVSTDDDASARWTHDRVQAHIDSVRRLVQEYRERETAYRAAAEDPRFMAAERLESHAAWAAFGEAVRILALPYRDHPDYQPEWSPDWRWRPTPPRSETGGVL